MSAGYHLDRSLAHLPDMRSQAWSNSGGQNFGMTGGGPATRQSTDRPMTTQNPKSEAVRKISQSAELLSIAQKTRANPEWLRRRAVVDRIAGMMPDMVPLLLGVPAQDNPFACRLLQTIANARGEPLPDFPTLLSIYIEDELSFFTAFQHLSDEDFLDCLQMGPIEARRPSSLHHLQASQPVGFRHQSTGPLLANDFRLPAQVSRVSADSTYASRPSSFEHQTHGTVASSPTNAATPYEDHPSPYHEVGSGIAARNVPRYANGQAVDEEARYKCYKCRDHWPADANGLDKWTNHQMLKYNGGTLYICGHDTCEGYGKTYETLKSHHHKKLHKDCLKECPIACPHDSQVTTQEIPCRVACVCLDCEELVIFSGDDCFRKLVDHWKETHLDLIMTGMLNKNPKNFSQRMEDLIREREELGFLLEHMIEQRFPTERPQLFFDHANKNVVKLLHDLQFGLDGSAEDIEMKEANIVRIFLTLGTAHLRTVNGRTTAALPSSHKHESSRPTQQQPNRPQYPPRRDSIYPASNVVGYAAPVVPPWNQAQGPMHPTPLTASSTHQNVTSQDSSRPMSGVWTGIIEAYMPQYAAAHYPTAGTSANPYYTEH